MYHTTPPPSPLSASPPVTPRSGVPLLLQAANRESRSPSRSSTFHYPSSHRDAHLIEPLPTLSYHHPPPLPREATTAPPPSGVLFHHDGLAFPAPPRVSPFHHGRIDSSVPRYALEDVVVRDAPEVVPGYTHHCREPSESSTQYYHEDSDSTGQQRQRQRRGGGGGGGSGDSDSDDTKLVVNKEGFLEHEVEPVRGFWSRWFRGMVILVAFLAIVTGVAIGVSEYFDSKQQHGRRGGGDQREGEAGSAAQGGSSTGAAGGTTTAASGSGSTLDSLLITVGGGGSTQTVTGSSTTSRMRTVLRTTMTTNPASERSTTAPHGPVTTTSGAATTATTTTGTLTADSGPNLTASDDSTTTDDGAGPDASNPDDDSPASTTRTTHSDSVHSAPTDTVDPTEQTATTGRLFGLASETPQSRR